MDPLYVKSLLYTNFIDSSNSDDLYNDNDWNDAHSAVISSATPANNVATHSAALPLATPESNVAVPSAPISNIPTSAATAASPERENLGIRGPEPGLTDSNMTGVTNTAQNLASTLNGSSAPQPPLAGTSNTEAAGISQGPVKCIKGLAVVGTGLTDKYVGYCISRD